MKRFCGIKILLPAVCLFYGFRIYSASELSASTGVLLNKLIASGIDPSIKEQKLEVTPEGFLRFRRKLTSGKQEYFAFHFSRYREMKYLGTEEQGYAEIMVADSNIIIQTFNDPKGDIDSMGTGMRLNFQHCSAEELSRLALQFAQMKKEMGK